MNVREFGGPWTQDKLNILENYLRAYVRVLKNQPFTLTFVDGFAGTGVYTESASHYEEFGEYRRGSAWIALQIDDRPFDRLIFIDKDKKAAESLRSLAIEYPGRDINVSQNDANVRIPEFCQAMGGRDRAVVFLDPFATQVSWATVDAIANTQKSDCWILFPRMAITRMMPNEKEPEEATGMQLDRIFGGRNFWQESYDDSAQQSLFDGSLLRERESGERIAYRYKKRLENVFAKVAQTPKVLKNSNNAPLFDLFFGASNPRGANTAVRIADHILKHM